MDCHRVRESMFQATDNELPAEILVHFREHLSFCPDCSHKYSYVGRLVAVIRERCCRLDAPSRLKVRILSSFPHRGGMLQEVELAE
jgi:mycothiol system anti-sigma-R factor